MQPLPTLEDDGLVVGSVRDWAERKYRLIANYAQMFATSMKDKWSSRVYIDLFAGAGRGRIAESQRIIPTSPMLALDVQNPFDRYIFCDINPDYIAALRQRASNAHASRDMRYLTGDANVLVDQILNEVPVARRGAGVLSFCVVDPYNLRNLKFRTIERLSSVFVDFLVLIPSHMDANRNERSYRDERNTTIAEFLGNPDWREAWDKSSGDFGLFIVDQFGLSMKRLGFIYEGLGNEVPVYLPQKNVKLYHLAFYSKSKLGMKFWREARKYSDAQLDLFD